MNHEEFENQWVPRTIRAYSSFTTDQKTTFLSKLLETMGHQEKYHLQTVLPELLFRDFITLLPNEILEKVLNFLTLQDLLNCCLVSKGWNKHLSTLDFIWKHQAFTLGMGLTQSGKLQ